MADAGQLSFQGKLTDNACVKVDHAKALALQASDTAQFKSFVRILRDRAVAGNPAAAKALAHAGISPLSP